MQTTEHTTVAAAFCELQERAETHWNELGHDQPVIMVGTATCGRAAGSIEVLQTFRDEIKKHNLDCPVIEVGCMGHCYAEPLTIIRKPGFPAICYGYVNPVIAERLVKEFVMGENPCPEFVIAALEENDILPSFNDFPRAQHEQKIIMRENGPLPSSSERMMIFLRLRLYSLY